MTQTPHAPAPTRPRAGRGWFLAAIGVALLSALAAYAPWGAASASSSGWFAYTPLSSSTPEIEAPAIPYTDWAAFALLALACLLLGRSAWLAAREAHRPGGPGGRAAWRYIALVLVIALGTTLVSAGLRAWTDGAVVWSPFTGPDLGGWFALDVRETFERVMIAADSLYAMTMLAWFGLVAFGCLIAVALAARNGSPLPPREQQEG